MTTNNMSNIARKPLAVGTAAAITLSSVFALGATTPVNAAPLSISQTAVKEAAPQPEAPPSDRPKKPRAPRKNTGTGKTGAKNAATRKA